MVNMSKEATLWFYPVNSLQGEKMERRLSTSGLIIAQRFYTIINVRTWIKKTGRRENCNTIKHPLRFSLSGTTDSTPTPTPFLTDYAVVDRIISHLKLPFVAER